MKEIGYKAKKVEPCLYFTAKGRGISLLLVYADDAIEATNSKEKHEKLFQMISAKYDLRDLGELALFLGVEVEQRRQEIYIYQTKYCSEVIFRYGLAHAHSSRIPMEVSARFSAQDDLPEERYPLEFNYRAAIGSLMYLATSTRPDIAFAVGYLSRFVGKPTQKYCGAVKKIMRYLAGTKTTKIIYQRCSQ